MTHALHATDCAPGFDQSLHLMRDVIPGAGYGVPAAALADRTVADWVRTHGVTVTVRDDDELDLLQDSGIRTNQIVFRCGRVTNSIRRAVSLGATRFIVGTEIRWQVWRSVRNGPSTATSTSARRWCSETAD